MKRLALPLASVLGVVAAVLWWWPADPAPIRIGLALNLSGHGGTAGQYIREGAMLAVEDVNAHGGVRGRPLELLVKDDRNTAEGILSADRALMDAGVLAIIGHVTSESTLIAHPEVTSRGTLLFTPYAATTELSGRDDLFLRTSVDVTQYARRTAALLREWAAVRVAYLMDMSNRTFVEDYVARTGGELSGVAAAEVRVDPREGLDWDGLLAGLLGSQPDAIVLLTEVSVTGIAAQKLRAAGYSGRLLATLWAQTPDLMHYGGSAAEGITLLSFIDPENQRPDYQRFSRRMEERLGRPANARSTRSYEAITILADALTDPRATTAEGLKAALLGGTFETLMGRVRFDAYGDVVRPVYEIRVEGGRFKRVREVE